MARQRPRARDLGVPFEGTPGAANSITDVKEVAVGYSTLVSGGGERGRRTEAVRTGVTAILPRGRRAASPVFAGWFSLNGNGEMTGTAWIDESGLLEGPVMITNTHSVGTVRDAVIAWQRRRRQKGVQPWSLPVVAETWDGWLNDIDGFHVRSEHVFAALDGARGGRIAEGNVGGGTGMVCYGFKGGTGTASRIARGGAGAYTIGVLVQANHGLRHQLLIAGVPVGRGIAGDPASGGRGPGRQRGPRGRGGPGGESGSIIIVVATDAPLVPHQLKRLARRAALGLARTGAVSGNGSGDIFLAFSTANAGAGRPRGAARVLMLANQEMDPLFAATVQATEEAIVNALVAARTMTGIDGHTAVALPQGLLVRILGAHGRLAAPGSARL